MKKTVPKLLLLILFLLSFISVQAQVNRCALNLIEARNYYNSGQIEDVPGLLVDCLEGGLSSDERIEAYKLIINSYIFDDYPDMAEEYMLRFLTDYPDYEVSDEDLFEFVSLFDLFDTKARFSIGGFVGTNFTGVSVSEPFGVHNLNDVTGDYSASTGFQAGAVFNYFLNEKMEVSAELSFARQKFSYELTPFSFTKTAYSESMSSLRLPLSVVYQLSEKEIKPYLRVGLMPALLFGSKGSYARTFTGSGTESYSPLNMDDTDISDSRNSLLFNGFLGGGVRYNLNGGYIFADVRYNKGFSQLVDQESRREAGDPVWLYYLQQDSFFMNEFTISVGFTKSFFKPKRKN